MAEVASQTTGLILLVGGVLIAALLIKAWLVRTAIPSLVGFLLLGLAMRLADHHFAFLTADSLNVMHFMGQVGLFALLFKAGLDSNLLHLLAQIRRASLVWLFNILGTGILTYLAADLLLGLSGITSLILAAAFTATSVGVSVAVWQEAGALDTPDGNLLVDVAEMDDISAVILMAALFALLPGWHEGGPQEMAGQMAWSAGWLFVKFGAFIAFCALFSALAEKRLTTFFRQLESPPEPMLMIAGVALLIAAAAGMLGFSVAVGAFLAGLVFSRDPSAVHMETSFLPIHAFFSPFFFVGIGLDLEPSFLSGALGLGLVLTLVAVVGKLISNGLPIWVTGGLASALLVSTSMVPRAEIAMVIMQQAHRLGDWAVPGHVYGAAVLVTLLTCTFSPLAVRVMLRRWPPKEET